MGKAAGTVTGIFVKKMGKCYVLYMISFVVSNGILYDVFGMLFAVILGGI